MFLSSRTKESQTSITLKVNEKINKMSAEGLHVYNMTGGQLNLKPSVTFIKAIEKQLNFLKSYQYSPLAGMAKLRKKFIQEVSKTRGIEFNDPDVDFDCVISNGSKHSLYNAMGALVNPGDEVIILTPYWVSYPAIVKFWGGIPKVVKSHAFDAYTPSIEDIEKTISSKTKLIILNSPNNPAGIHYSDAWMKDFAIFLKRYDDLLVISDEVYSELVYFDPKPTYFYQHDKSLLKKTIVINSISKSFASTGLRVGYCIADARLTKAMAKIQSQTTSGPNSLIQRALIDYDFSAKENYFDEVKELLRGSAQFLGAAFREANLAHCFYQTTSAFYYLLDFSRMPIYKRFKGVEGEDFSEEIVQDILEKTGVALVPGSGFGYPNSARMSLTLDQIPFEEAITKLVEHISRE